MNAIRDAIPIGMFVLGALGLVFGIFQFVVSRKVAKLGYKVVQFSDFEAPGSIFSKMSLAPVLVEIRSIGTKAAEGVDVRIDTVFSISEFEVKPKCLLENSANELHVAIDRLNPSTALQISFYTDGPPFEDQIKRLSITHNEGKAVKLGEPSEFSAAIMRGVVGGVLGIPPGMTVLPRDHFSKRRT